MMATGIALIAIGWILVNLFGDKIPFGEKLDLPPSQLRKPDLYGILLLFVGACFVLSSVLILVWRYFP